MKEKLKTYNVINGKKGLIISEIDENSKELIKVNENKINYGNNEVSGIEENKKKLIDLINIRKTIEICRNWNFERSHIKIRNTY